MCLLNFSFRHHSKYNFLLVGNRDEFYGRPTQQLHWWNDQILAGKDLKDGGTWMGINRQGLFAALTNHRDLTNIKSNAPSRGNILKDFLEHKFPLEEMHRFLRTQGSLFNGFNLIYGTIDEMYYFSNVNQKLQQLYPGIYGLSNAFLDTPWRKVVRSKELFTSLTSYIEPDENKLIEMMKNEDKADDAELPSTGVPHDLEKQLSAMFITTENYGTRLTTFVSIDKSGHVKYHEKGYQPESDQRFEFTIEHPFIKE